MKYKGVTYDIGTEYSPGQFTVNNLSAETIASDMKSIKEQLHCNSVRLYGKETDKLIQAADIALQTGLDVWLSPRLVDADVKETIAALGEAASRFEPLRVKFPHRELIFIV